LAVGQTNFALAGETSVKNTIDKNLWAS